MIYNTTDGNIEEILELALAEEAELVELERQFADSEYEPDTSVIINAIVLSERQFERRVA